MWLATKHGFFSIVCGRDNAGNVDHGVLVIRARQRKHLQNLIVATDGKVPLGKVVWRNGTDYPYRMAVLKNVGLKLIVELSAGIDYDNFKDAAAAEHPDDLAYRRFLGATWSEGCRMEDHEITEQEWDRRTAEAGAVSGLPRIDFDQSHDGNGSA